ncbi:STE3-domain-containing protein [Sistotremastrum suecicum HHB10207 ss-3]|uniref:STE3-domain-containing protein n=1 Tax=Sistotremastrum suecicum HHB10207 ss-3 TaxID=1314776 RepID=A0A166CQN6_9AGAM|nr:STE3-domain-containing protein [Sistotremastrum suecicum HHB10207 ss-3]
MARDDVYLAFSFIGFVIVLIPMPWHLHAWNAGTCLFMTYVALGCLIHFINSIVWADNLLDPAPVYCDITTKILIGLSVGLPAASFCINRRLYHIASISQVRRTPRDRQKSLCIDLAIGLGLPILVMILHYIVQGHRYDIFEGYGCWPTTYNTVPAYPLVFMWPILLGTLSLVYCVLSIRAFMKQRKQMKDILSSNNNLTPSRYLRLMALAGIEMLCTVPIATYYLWLDATVTPVYPWISWEDTHFGFSQVRLYPKAYIELVPSLGIEIKLNSWIYPAVAMLFFLFFGFAEEARKSYYRLYCAAATLVGLKPATSSRGYGSGSNGSSAGGSRTLGGSWTSKLGWLKKSSGAHSSSTQVTYPAFDVPSKVSKRDSVSSFGDISETASIGPYTISVIEETKEHSDSSSPLPPQPPHTPMEPKYDDFKFDTSALDNIRGDDRV